MRSHLTMIILLATFVACAASPPPPPAAGRSQIWGHVRVLPHEGVRATDSHANAYGDRRLRDVSLVDYSSPGFAIVFVDHGPAPAAPARVTIRTSRFGTAFDPALVVLGAAGKLSIRNETATRHILSYPAAKLVVALGPDEAVDIDIPRSGEQALFLLDAPEATNTIFAAPGAFSRVSGSGRYVLSDLEPGEHRIHAWHKRFPSASKSIDLQLNSVIKLDFDLGVGRGGGHAHAH